MSLDRWLNVLLAVALAAVVMFAKMESRLMDASYMGIFRAEVQRVQDSLLRNQQELSRVLQEVQTRLKAVETQKEAPK